MKRTTITMDGNGRLSIPSNLEDLWMSEGEYASCYRPETQLCDTSYI